MIHASDVPSLQGDYINLTSSSIDIVQKMVAVGLNSEVSGNQVVLVNLTDGNVKSCPAPLSSGKSSVVHCVVWSEGRLFVIHDGKKDGPGFMDDPTGFGFISELIYEPGCTYEPVRQSLDRVKGSSEGPGGQCVAVPRNHSIMYMVQSTDSPNEEHIIVCKYPPYGDDCKRSRISNYSMSDDVKLISWSPASRGDSRAVVLIDILRGDYHIFSINEDLGISQVRVVGGLAGLSGGTSSNGATPPPSS